MNGSGDAHGAYNAATVSWVLAALALLVAVLAFLDGRRARRAAVAAAPTPAPGDAPDETSQTVLDSLREDLAGLREEMAGLRRARVDIEGGIRDLERRLHAAEEGLGARFREIRTNLDALARASSPAGSAAGGDATPRARTPEEGVQAELEERGFADVVLRENPGDLGTWLFEGRRRGIVTKGRVRRDEQGHLAISLEPISRAFP